MRVANRAWTVDVYVIRAGDRTERVAVLGADFRDNLIQTNTTLKPRYLREIQKLVFTMQFANAPAGPARPATIRGGGIRGVWTGLALSFGRLKRHVAIFFDDGTAYFGPFFPPSGLLGVDPSVEQPRARRYWGRYEFANGSGTLSAPAGTIPLHTTGQSLRLTVNRQDHSFVRTLTPEPSQLQGTWCLADGHCIRFAADGRFEDSGAVRVIEHATYPFPESPAGGSGRWEARDYTLILRYADGPELHLALPGLLEPTARELTIGFNLDVLTKR